MKPMLHTRVHDQHTRFRVELRHGVAIGPGKADILQGVQDTGSLAETARTLNMSYQRVWTLVKAMNEDFVRPLVETQRGGASRGGASLTETGQQVLAAYRSLERTARRAVDKKLPTLLGLIKNAG